MDKALLNKILLLLIISLILVSCGLFGGRKGDQKVARAYNKYLYTSDLVGVIPAGTSSADSVVIIKRYIDNWIRQQIYLQQAEATIELNNADLNRKIEDYRNSLVLYAYESRLVKTLMDTAVSKEIMDEYYQKHQEEFKLRDHIVKLNYVKVPLDAPDINKVRRLIRSENENEILELEEYAVNNAASYFLDQESWFIFNDILRDIPINPQNQESFLRYNRFLELNDQYYRYFLYIRDFKLEGSTSPLAFQSENIKAIILNHRKQSFINEYRQNAFKEAARNESFEIY